MTDRNKKTNRRLKKTICTQIDMSNIIS
jgi:hypothetical protein